MASGKKAAFSLDEFEVPQKAQETQEAQTVRKEQEAQATQEVQKVAFGETQGRKGCKAKRINMAFSDENHQYLKFESRRNGMSITEFTNMIITKYRNNN